MKRVSVVILNWNGVDMLRKFIPSVMDNSVGEGIEICVADNASSDGSLEMLRSEFPVVRLIELDQNYGFAEGYNRALEQVLITQISAFSPLRAVRIPASFSVLPMVEVSEKFNLQPNV